MSVQPQLIGYLIDRSRGQRLSVRYLLFNSDYRDSGLFESGFELGRRLRAARKHPHHLVSILNERLVAFNRGLLFFPIACFSWFARRAGFDLDAEFLTIVLTADVNATFLFSSCWCNSDFFLLRTLSGQLVAYLFHCGRGATRLVDIRPDDRFVCLFSVLAGYLANVVPLPLKVLRPLRFPIIGFLDL